ncbi:hypothetical protein STHU_08330 [Allostella humosa]|nr:hypothetical protein STHU_08330 [Stella humosa]
MEQGRWRETHRPGLSKTAGAAGFPRGPKGAKAPPAIDGTKRTRSIFRRIPASASVVDFWGRMAGPGDGYGTTAPAAFPREGHRGQ